MVSHSVDSVPCADQRASNFCWPELDLSSHRLWVLRLCFSGTACHIFALLFQYLVYEEFQKPVCVCVCSETWTLVAPRVLLC